MVQRIPGGLGSKISRHSALEGGEVVSLTHRPSLPPVMFMLHIFTRECVDHRTMVRSERNMSLKNPVTQSGIDLGTARLVAQRLNHYATRLLSVNFKSTRNFKNDTEMLVFKMCFSTFYTPNTVHYFF